MGGGSETIRDAQIMGLSKEYGKLKKKVFLEVGKFVPNGMNIVNAAYGQNIVDMKSMYNKAYLTAMGYAPNDSIEISKISEGKVLEYTKNNIDSRATQIYNPTVSTLNTMDQVILELQDKPDFKKSVMSFTHTDGKKYYYYTSVQNGSYIDISCYLNQIDTVTPYLTAKYPEGYKLLDLNAKPLNSNGSIYWKVDVEFITFVPLTVEVEEIVEEEVVIDGVVTIVEKVIIVEKVVMEEVEVIVQEEVLVDGKIVIVDKVVIVEQPVRVEKKEIVSENIDCVFIYISALDSEEAQMYTIAQQHSGPFTITGTYTEEGSDEYGSYTFTAVVTGTFTVTYIGNGEFSYDMNAPNPNPNIWYRQGLAWENGVRSYEGMIKSQIDQAVINNVRKLIWDYNVAGGDFDSTRRTYAQGDILNSIIVKEYVDSYPIIPLKRNFNLVNSKKMDIVLKKIGLEGKDFHESIRQKEICDAYLFFGIPFNPINNASTNNPGLIEYIFEYFTTLANVRENYRKNAQRYGATSLNTGYDGMGIHQNYNVKSWVVVEPAARPVGTYWSQTVNEIVIVGYEEKIEVDEHGYTHEVAVPITETYTYAEYYYQESEAYYIRIRVVNIQYWYTLGNIKWYNNISLAENDGGKRKLRLPILKQITNKMNFNMLCDVIEQSMSFAVYTQVTVKKKWYQSGFFKFVMVGVIIVVAYFTGGAALSLLGPVMGVVVAGAIVLSAAMSIISMLTGASFGIFGTIVGIVAAIGGGYASLVSSGMTVTQTVMFTASQVLNLVSEVNNLLFTMKMGSRQEAYSNMLAQQEKEKEKLEDEYKKLHENKDMIVNMFNNFKSLDDIDNYYNMAVGDFDSYNLMLEYATDYDKFYDLK